MITEIKIWWDDQDHFNDGWCARAYNGSEQIGDEQISAKENANDDELIAALPRTWQTVENIRIIR